VPGTTETGKSAKEPPKKSVIGQLQTAGEGAIGRITQNAAARSALQSASQLRERGEKLVRSIDTIEKRLTAIEKRLDALEGTGGKGGGTRSTAKKASSTRAKPAAAPSKTGTASES
jgi:hypothetical protein